MPSKLRELRKAQRMTLKQLGDAVSLTASCISNYEQGLRKLDLPTAAKIAAALNCTVDDLIEREPA